MDKNNIFWGILAGVGSLMGAGATILTGVASNKVIQGCTRPTANAADTIANIPEPAITPEAPKCPPEMK